MNCEDGVLLINAITNNKLELVRYLVENSADIHDHNDNAIKLAIEKDYFEIVNYIEEVMRKLYIENENVNESH